MFMWLILLRNYITNDAHLGRLEGQIIDDQLGTLFGRIGFEEWVVRVMGMLRQLRIRATAQFVVNVEDREESTHNPSAAECHD